MRTHLMRLRAALVLLLVGSGLLFAIGSTTERHQHHTDRHPAAAATHVEGTNGGTASSREGKKQVETRQSGSEAGATVLGVNTESVALTVVAVVLSLLLAFAVWLGRWSRLAFLSVAGFGLVFAAGDGRELVHQLTDSHAGLAAVAAILIALHLAVTALAAALFPRRGAAGEFEGVGRLA